MRKVGLLPWRTWKHGRVNSQLLRYARQPEFMPVRGRENTRSSLFVELSMLVSELSYFAAGNWIYIMRIALGRRP